MLCVCVCLLQQESCGSKPSVPSLHTKKEEISEEDGWRGEMLVSVLGV